MTNSFLRIMLVFYFDSILGNKLTVIPNNTFTTYINNSWYAISTAACTHMQIASLEDYYSFLKNWTGYLIPRIRCFWVCV